MLTAAEAQQFIVKKLKQYLIKQTVPQPFLFFIILIYSHFYQSLLISDLFYIFALLLTVSYHFNMLFILPAFLYTNHPLISVLMFALSLLSCNKRWKTLFFALCTMHSYFQEQQTSYLVITLMSFFMCIITYKNLIFQSITENAHYFTGFFLIGLLHCFMFVSIIFSTTINTFSLIFIPLAAASLGYTIITYRLQSLRIKDSKSIKSSRQMVHYISLLKQDLDNEYKKKAKLLIHQRQCQKLECFCKNKQFAYRQQFFLRQIYQNAKKQLEVSNDPIFVETYVDFLIKTDQVANALYYLINWNSFNYFCLLSRIKCEMKIQEYLNDENSSNSYQKQYAYALEYDQHCQHVFTEIHQILKLKIKFWKEVAKEAPMLINLRQHGCALVDRMYRLNEFYGQVIKPQEQKLYSFDSTVIYAMYLISTTSFKDYSKSIIKNTAKLMEEVSISENNSSETFAIRTIVKNNKKSFIKDEVKYFQKEKERDTRKNICDIHSNNFKLVIDRVSSGFCRLLKISKRELMGKQLNYVIPEGYKEVHSIRLSYLLNYDSDKLNEIVPSKVFHKQLKLPIKGLNNQLYMGYICIKFHVDINKGLSFVSIIKKMPQRSLSALINFKGEVKQKQNGFLMHILEHPEIKKYLANLNTIWNNEKVIKEENFNIMANSKNYGVTISSPYLGLFLDKDNLTQSDPPIHVDITNEQSNKFFNSSALTDNKVGQELKKMQNMLLNYDQQSSASSSKGISSAVTVLTNFSQSNTVPIYKYIFVVFFIVILLCLAINISFFLFKTLDWDNSGQIGNPVVDSMNFYFVELLNQNSFLNLQDSTNFKLYQNQLNISKIATYFTADTYQEQLADFYQYIQTQMKQRLEKVLSQASTLLNDKITQIFDRIITISNNKSEVTIISADQAVESISLAYHQTQMLYVVDFNLLQQGSDFSNIMELTIYDQAQKNINVSSKVGLRGIIKQSIEKSRLNYIIYGIVCAIILLLLLIPLCLVLRKRYETHERVYDLLASIDSEEVIKQIKSLLYISNILNNYSESHQIIKGNVLDYQENIIRPKREDGRRRSAENQLIYGLQKYDISQSNDQDKFMMTDRVKLMNEDLSNKLAQKAGSNVFSMIKSELADVKKNQAQLKKRKRSGQLDNSGSEYDPNVKIQKKHLTLYAFILIFIVMVIVGIMVNINYTYQVDQAQNNVIGLYKDLSIKNHNLIKIKTYLWGGSAVYIDKYHPTDLIQDLSSLTQQLIVEDIYSQKEINVITPCPQSDKLLCTKQYSLRILEGQLATLTKQLLEKKIYAQISNNTNLSDQIDIYQQIYYLQSLSNKILKLSVQMGNALFSKILQDSVNHDNLKNELLMYAVILCSINTIIGFVIICGMKKQYLKEVYMLTFLNDFMIIKNKRVESYLQSLSKNTVI